MYKRFPRKEVLQIVPIPSGSAVISMEALFCEWADSKLHICFCFGRNLLLLVCLERAVEVRY